MGIVERKERNKTEIRAAILQAALQLFTAKGYENVTIREIAKKIEYSPATIYLYFKDKDDIFHNLHEEGFKIFYSIQLSTLSIKDLYERLKKHGELYVKFAMEHQEYYDIMCIMRVTGLKMTYQPLDMDLHVGVKSYEFLRQNVQDCIDAGYFKGKNVDMISFMVWSLVHGMSSLIIRDRADMIPNEFLQEIIKDSISTFFTKFEVC